MEVEWTQKFPFPFGSIHLPAATSVEYWPSFGPTGSPLRITVGQRSGLSGFVIYAGQEVVELIKQALLNPEQIVLAKEAEVRVVERRRQAPTRPQETPTPTREPKARPPVVEL